MWNETFPKGEEIRVSNLELYSVGSSNEFSVIVFHDIRGYKVAQTRVFCDRLAAEFQSHVVLPDFFHGETAPLDHLLFGNWLSINGIWSNVSRDLNIVSSWLKQSNPKKNISLIGFCWGGLQVDTKYVWFFVLTNFIESNRFVTKFQWRMREMFSIDFPEHFGFDMTFYAQIH